MCGRFTLSSPGDVVAEVFDLPEVPQLAPRYNIAPTQPAAVVLLAEKGQEAERVGAGTGTASGMSGEGTRQPCGGASPGFRGLRMFRWGLVPSWADDPAAGGRMINARAESVATKPSFRSAFRTRRCLVAADGFYEWQKLERRKQPHYIHMQDQRPFAFAGLWEHWGGTNAEAFDSFTIITTGPNELIARLHDRMPVILRPEDYAFWLDPGNDSTSALEGLLRPYPAELMVFHPVGTLVNNPRVDSPECVARPARL